MSPTVWRVRCYRHRGKGSLGYSFPVLIWVLDGVLGSGPVTGWAASGRGFESLSLRIPFAIQRNFARIVAASDCSPARDRRHQARRHWAGWSGALIDP
jgi:hypothetical protein